MAEAPPDGHWHLDKKVPLALIATIIAQTVAIGIWVGTLSSRVSELETKAGRSLDVRDRVIRVESDVMHVRGSVERIEGLLGRKYPDPG